MADMSLDSTGLGVPQTFRTASRFNINFDWIDYINNVGYIRFYGIYVAQTAGAGYFLTTRVIDAPNVQDVAGVYSRGIKTLFADGNFEEINFNLLFNTPMFIQGGAYAYIQATKYFTFTGNNNGLKFTIYHVTPAGVETSLGTAKSASITTDGSWYKRDLVQITMTEKSFAIGDTLRLEVIWEDVDGIYLFHDPGSSLTFTDVQTRTIGSDFFIEVPFRIQN